MNTDLFAPGLQRRLDATQAMKSEETVYQWFADCRGAPNAWLLLVGPSPGAADKNEAPRNRELRQKAPAKLPAIDAVQFGSNQRRNTGWLNLMKCFTKRTDDGVALKMTALVNLDWINSNRERGIDQQWLVKGYKDVWEVIQKGKPRIVVALTQRTYDILRKEIQEHSLVKVPAAPDSRSPLAFQIPEYSATSMMCLTPRHPSWGFGPITQEKAKPIIEWFDRNIGV